MHDNPAVRIYDYGGVDASYPGTECLGDPPIIAGPPCIDTNMLYRTRG